MGGNKINIPNASSPLASSKSSTWPLAKVNGKLVENFTLTMRRQYKDQNQARFLKCYAVKGTVTFAAEMAQMSPQCHHQWMREDPTYPPRYAEAQQAFNDLLDAEIYRRGREGIDDLQLYRGAPIMMVDDKGVPQRLVKKVYSDGLLMFAAKGAMPHKYKENGTQINAVGAVQINLTPSEERL